MPLGYSAEALDRWAECARIWARGGVPTGLQSVTDAKSGAKARDVFLYVISGFKAHNPAAAMALIERIASP